MSFRSRLTLSFTVIVLLTMTGFGVLVFRLISDSQAGKADARAAAVASTVLEIYRSDTRDAAAAGLHVAQNPQLAAGIAAHSPARTAVAARSMLSRERLVRLVVTARGRTLAAVGDTRALAPARQRVRVAGTTATATILTSSLSAARLGRETRSTGAAILIRRAGRTILSTLPRAAAADLTAGTSIPVRGTRSLAGKEYRVASFAAPGFAAPVRVAIFTDRAALAGRTGRARVVASVALAGFILVALAFAVAVSRALQGQIGGFLAAARRLGSGDFSTPVPTQGNDEFAQLGHEFNAMASELEGRLVELDRQRERLQDSVRRIGRTFASNLDRAALLDLVTQTALDAVEARVGRASLWGATGQMEERARVGELEGAGEAVRAAEAEALMHHRTVEAERDGVFALVAPLSPENDPAGVTGLLAVARREKGFSVSDREILTSLAGQAAISLENVALHELVRRQAVTDELTGLSNHRRFQETLVAELERAARFGQEVGLVMLDVDDFKRVNDTFGHPQGDEVLRAVARVLRDCSRDVDEPARYGGEEMVVILPQTDLEGAFRAAERIRTQVEALRVPRLDGDGAIAVTVSLGVSASSGATRADLVEAADLALYEAKRQGKNRTSRGSAGAPAETV